MGAAVTLQVVDGPQKGREFRFEAHDTFVFGRSSDCRCSIPDDPYISGRHFLIEVNPPGCVLRDLGSKNGTKVNGGLSGRRAKGESPESAGGRAQVIALKDGDLVQAGLTQFKVGVHVSPECAVCGGDLEPAAAPNGGERGLTDEPRFCEPCRRARGQRAEGPPKAAQPEPPKPGFKTDFLAGMAKALGAKPLAAFPGLVVEKKLKDGGMGQVYLARRAADNRTVIVKVVKPQGPAAPQQMLKLFQREMEVSLLGLRPGHPNIVEFIESGLSDDVFYFTMEYYPGGSVAELMYRRGGRLPVHEAIDISAQALEGLSFAHAKDIVHRDIKPDNILLTVEEGPMVAKVADFGLAKNFALAGMSGYTSASDGGAGTAEFMPKEQLLQFRDTKPVSDVFSLGASLYNMLTGEFVYDGPDFCADIVNGWVVPIEKRGVALPKGLIDVVGKATAPEARDRFQTAAEFKAALLRAGGA